MKIYAKRKRKLDNEEKADSVEKKYESDPIVLELLKQDPSTWNAKQRRLVKRYQERWNADPQLPVTVTGATSTIATTEGPVTTSAVGSVDEALQEQEINLQNVSEVIGTAEEQPTSSTDPVGTAPQCHDGTDVVVSTFEGEPLKVEQETFIDASKSALCPPIDDDIKAILDQLNSKQRRKLVRQLERDGDMEMLRSESIRVWEAEKIQSVTTLTPVTTAVTADDDDVSSPPLKKRRRQRKPVVEVSTLPPEERMRREEQRRMQQEAAAVAMTARTSTTTPPQLSSSSSSSPAPAPAHQHPLNSERRRANRRKPKWEPKSFRKKPNEHDTSGYHMRKITKSEVAE
jgi:hypothetical protein